MRRAARNAGYLLAGEAASRLFGFVTTAVLARRLGLDGFGQIGFATSVLAYAVACTDLGLVALGTRSVAQSRGEVARFARALLPMRSLLALLAALLMVGAALVLSRSPAVTGLLCVYALAVVVQAVVLEWVFIGVEQAGLVSLSRTISNGAYCVFVLLLVHGAGDILLVPASFAGGTGLGALFLFVLYVPRFGWPRPHFDRAEWRGLVRCAWPLGAAALLTQVHVNLGLVLMGLVRSYHETGVYNSAYRLVFFLITLDRVFYTSFFPAVTRVMATERTRLPEVTGTALRLVSAVALPICAGAALLAGPVLRLVFGTKYLPAIPSLEVLVWFLALSMFNSLAGYTLVADGRERLFLRNTAVGVAVSVVFSAVAVPLLGAPGAALAIVGGEAAILVAMAPDFVRVARPRVGLRTLAPVASVAVMVVAVLLLLRHVHPLLAAAAGVLVYCATLLLTRGVTRGDITRAAV